MVAVHGQRRGSVGHLHLNALHRTVRHVTDRIAENECERRRQSFHADGVSLVTGLAAVGDGPDGFAGLVLKGLCLLDDVKRTRAVGHGGRLLHSVGEVAVIVEDVADEKGAAGRAVELHVSQFVDGIKVVANMRDATDLHAHRNGDKRVDRAQTAVHDRDVRVL